MKTIGAVFMILVLLGCGENHVAKPYYEKKARGWQEREAQCPPYDTPQDFTPSGDIREDFLTLQRPLGVFQHTGREDVTDYWQTSCQTLAQSEKNHRGDCEDAAILWYRIMKDSIPDADVRIRVLERGKFDHIVTIIYTDEQVFEVDEGRIRVGESAGPVIIEFCEHSFY